MDALVAAALAVNQDYLALGTSLRSRPRCSASPVTKDFEGEVVWDGVVQVFDLIDHPEAKRCYVWSHAVDDSQRRRFVAVLHKPTVGSPQAAVRAAIASEYRRDD